MGDVLYMPRGTIHQAVAQTDGGECVALTWEWTPVASWDDGAGRALGLRARGRDNGPLPPFPIEIE